MQQVRETTWEIFQSYQGNKIFMALAEVVMISKHIRVYICLGSKIE